MPIARQDIVFGGALGAVLGIAYQLWRASSETGSLWNAVPAELGAAAAVGALAGIAAFVVRRLLG